ncbi:sigma-70 family RNA polymerase sigma factor [Nocardioides agariphilus]|jgi:RNA polymerase sigma factor (sigma-70 family)|uniref:Sigma-70 family RNA polymerase sigma factor n=1 Tax=Nocardioides agariphilus TaxID=433664 RepID=A0A930YR51_9ACTN|nr:sigma-70 family RNA polymerase sigma factor [Nocardioides agariphilus]MBF4769905.1 sigma-70 family RNA polymerase sigma factor [Nocardioides agariphilus]
MTMQDTGTTEDPASVWDAAGTSFARWRAGDPAALDELVKVMSPILWHVVRATGLSREQSEDVVQTAWLALVRNAQSVGDPQAVARWLCTTARREAWRVSKSASRSTVVEDDALEWHLPHEASPESAVVLSDEQARLWESLGQLPERCQKLLRIVAMEPRPDYARIAGELKMPIGSIGPTRGRCLDKLRHELERTGAGR